MTGRRVVLKGFRLTKGNRVERDPRRLNVIATCNAGGAGKWHPEHAAYLKDANAIIVPDNDDAGRAHAEAVAASLQGIAKRVRVLTLPDIPEKGDLSDWIAAGGTAEKLWDLVDQAPEWKPPSSDGPAAWRFPPLEGRFQYRGLQASQPSPSPGSGPPAVSPAPGGSVHPHRHALLTNY